ncbi:MAG TPA: NPCBM/NEW2 domain-containing protein [Myxococcota bacterium]|nr:NPCBM/NEW2 domain-containing protein [Myxococcota bacterium]HQK51405.1 NPCBM/NEW2 domain-containing protein [Myxococcota bacterium]
MRRLRLDLWWTLAGLTMGCSGNPGSDLPTDAPGDVLEVGDPSPETELPAACGNGTCESGESCRSCPGDCPCRCGDGLCTFGEFPALCPEDCPDDPLAATPPMGWNSWNRFACDIDEDLVLETAEAMVQSGLRDAGYRYLNLDDCWQAGRRPDGTILEDPRFPSGMEALARKVHEKGLRFGVYTCAGTMTCQQRPGSYGFEARDIQTYAAWGVDYVKVDWCFTEGLSARDRYPVFQRAIDALVPRRPMVLSICEWGKSEPWVWAPDQGVGQLWRTSGDIANSWFSVLVNAERAISLAAYAGPGHWNDPDMLEVGNGALTPEMARAHMSLWAMLAAPLIAGHDLRTMDEDTRAVLTQPEVIAIDQDPDGLPAMRLTMGPPQVLVRPLAQDGLRAVLLLNPYGEDSYEGRVSLQDLGLAPGLVEVRDVWQGRSLGWFDGSIRLAVDPEASRLLLVQGREPEPPPGVTSLADLPWRHEAFETRAARRNRSAAGTDSLMAPPLRMAGQAYPHGIGVQAPSVIQVHLGGRCDRFTARVGVDDQAPAEASVVFQVLRDRAQAWTSLVLRQGSAPMDIDIDLAGAWTLTLRVTVAGDSPRGDLAAWADAALECR